MEAFCAVCFGVMFLAILGGMGYTLVRAFRPGRFDNMRRDD